MPSKRAMRCCLSAPAVVSDMGLSYRWCGEIGQTLYAQRMPELLPASDINVALTPPSL